MAVTESLGVPEGLPGLVTPLLVHRTGRTVFSGVGHTLCVCVFDPKQRYQKELVSEKVASR